MSRTNYVFVDFENVQATDLERIANRPVKVTFILGERHARLPVDLVRKLLLYSSQVALVETGHSGKNALDLVLAQQIGQTRQADPGGYFHIVSKDKGFDALIGYLKDNGALAARHASFSEIPVLMNAAERVSALLKQFQANAASRPQKLKTLESHIQAAFGKALPPEDVQATVAGLQRAGAITISDKGNLTYPPN